MTPVKVTLYFVRKYHTFTSKSVNDIGFAQNIKTYITLAHCFN